MSPKLTSCALVGHFSDSRVAECAVVLVRELLRRGLQVFVDDSATPPGMPADVGMLPRAELPARSQLLIAIGGDGTLLQAARLAALHDVPVLGINRGRLGFLTDVLPQDMAASVDAVLEGRCAADRRALLEARLLRTDGSSERQLALNDVVLLRRESGRLLDFETRVDGRFVNSHSGDGLVIATATGSTAYALSCGGPIVDPQLDVLVLAPICPHTLSDRPIIIPGRSVIAVTLTGRGEGRAEVTCDATRLGDLQAHDRLEIGASGRAVTLLHPPGYDYFRLLRSKLHWGRGEAQHER
jgi:NAD+ kinase